MSDEEQTSAREGATRPSRRRIIGWIAGAAVVAVVAAIAIAIAVAPRGDAAGPRPSDSSSPASTPGASTGPSATPDASQPPATKPPTAPPADSGPFPELPPVKPKDQGAAEGISAQLVKFESVRGEVVAPGDVAAAAVRVTVEIKNTGSKPIDLNLVVMNAYMGPQRDPAETYEQPGGAPVSGSLAAGKTVKGVYLFRVPEDRRDDVTFVVDYHAGQPAITFRGPVP